MRLWWTIKKVNTHLYWDFGLLIEGGISNRDGKFPEPNHFSKLVIWSLKTNKYLILDWTSGTIIINYLLSRDFHNVDLDIVGLVEDAVEVVVCVLLRLVDVLFGVVLVNVLLVVELVKAEILEVSTLVTLVVLMRFWGPSVVELIFVLVCSAKNRQQTWKSLFPHIPANFPWKIWHFVHLIQTVPFRQYVSLKIQSSKSTL